ncbi:MAG: HAMP domain-containing histidine kinase [Lachnospiraceae bacterium]|nr:HAMP domain-containing histidine kinase [Lachnospiraceae bacterium]
MQNNNDYESEIDGLASESESSGSLQTMKDIFGSPSSAARAKDINGGDIQGKKRTHRIFSLRLWLFCIILTVVALPTGILSITLIRNVRRVELQNSVNEMKSQAMMLATKLASADYFNNLSDSSLSSQIRQQADLLNGRIQVINDSYRVVDDTYVTDINRFNYSENVIKCMVGNGGETSFETMDFVEISQPIIKPDANGRSSSIVGVLTVSADKKNMVQMVGALTELSVILLLLLAVIMIPLLFIVTWYLVRPFNELQRQIARTQESDTSAFVNERTYIETAQLSDSFNESYGRLAALSQSRQEFVSNVSHELKTPITSIRVLADSLMGMENVPIELYKEFMADISGEIDREAKIIDDLLSLTKLEKSAQALDISKVNVNDSMELILKRLSPIAKQRNVELLFESFRPVVAEIDDVKFSLAITNIVENAIKYNVEGGWVKLSLNADYQYFFIKIADSGVGIPDDEIDKVFDRFYRVDKARSRETGGTGLGLSITKSIVQMHHGAIRVYSKPGEGTTFVVRTPLSYVDN